MANLKLTIACGDYDRTRALRDGELQPEGIDLTYLALVPGETFWRMLNNEEFDASEMSLSSYTILRSEGDARFTALPIFPSRIFRHSCVYVNAEAGIDRPEDLKGKRIGVGDYQMTAAVWAKGFLQHDYGVRPQDMQWVTGPPVRPFENPEGVHFELLPAGESMEQMLEEGRIDALISVMIPKPFRTGSGRVVRLFADHRQVEQEYFERTGIFPIMHTFVVKTALLEAHPWVAVSLYKGFLRSRDRAYQRMYDTNALTVSLPWIIEEVEASRRIFGPQIWDYSVEGSRPTLEALTQYVWEQGLAQRKMDLEELFAPQINARLAEYLSATGEA